jgi:hypothetical protein
MAQSAIPSSPSTAALRMRLIDDFRAPPYEAWPRCSGSESVSSARYGRAGSCSAVAPKPLSPPVVNEQRQSSRWQSMTALARASVPLVGISLLCGLPRAALAQWPASCPICPDAGYAKYNFSAGEAINQAQDGRKAWDVSLLPNSPNGYEAQASVGRVLAGNLYVSDIQIHARTFNTQANADYLWIFGQATVCPWTAMPGTIIPNNPLLPPPFTFPWLALSGSLTASSLMPAGGLWIDLCTAGAGNSGMFAFTSDRIQSMSGAPTRDLTLDQLSYCCSSVAGNGYPPIGINERVEGILQVQTDIVNFSLAGPSSSNVDITLSVWANDASTTDDFALYASCTLPNTGTFSSSDPGPEQFIHLPSNYCVNGTIDIQVQDNINRAGTAVVFDLLASAHTTQNHVREIKAGIAIALDAGYPSLSTLEGFLSSAAGGLLTSTQGTYDIEQITVFQHAADFTGYWCWCGGNFCDICIRDCAPVQRSLTTNPLGLSSSWNASVNLCSDWWGGDPNNDYSRRRILVHEWGHHSFDLVDEYIDGIAPWSVSRCGHSIMDHAGNNDMPHYCRKDDHGLDNSDPQPPVGYCGIVYPYSDGGCPPGFPDCNPACQPQYSPYNDNWQYCYRGDTHAPCVAAVWGINNFHGTGNWNEGCNLTCRLGNVNLGNNLSEIDLLPNVSPDNFDFANFNFHWQTRQSNQRVGAIKEAQ